MSKPPGASSSLVRVGVAVFALGLLAVVVVFAMFAAGAHDLPLWLNIAAMLAPVGFGLALIGLFRQARRPGRRPAATSPTATGIAR
jgi:predicted alpha/beta-hydrolase family hydrolase